MTTDAPTVDPTAPVTFASVVADLADVVGVDASEIAPDDDLTDHGLDSVRLMVLVERWRAQGHEVEFATIAARPTARGCVEALGGQTD